MFKHMMWTASVGTWWETKSGILLIKVLKLQLRGLIS